MMSLSTDHLPLTDKLLVSLALLDWDQAKRMNPEHPIFTAPVLDLVVSDFGGAFPTQATGTVTGVPFYFRARHGEWTMAFGKNPIEKPELTMEGVDETAGMMEREDAQPFFENGARLISYVRKTRIAAEKAGP